MKQTIPKEFEAIKPFLSQYISQVLEEKEIANDRQLKQMSLLERMIRVEEELNSSRKTGENQLVLFEKRFEMIDKRFEMIDKRFEEMKDYSEKRFESVDKRFEEMKDYSEKRFESVDKRFEDMQRYMDKRFTQLTWLISIMMVSFSALVTVLKFLF